MTHYSTLVRQLPQRLQIEVTADLGPISGMSELQITTRYEHLSHPGLSGRFGAKPNLHCLQPPDWRS
jgi:hypothetical protein